MKHISAVAAPILASLYAERSIRVEQATAEVRRLERQNEELNRRLEAGLPAARPNAKERA